MSGNLHRPTNAGPDLGPAQAPGPEPAFVPASTSTAEPDESPELIVGAAFAGGLVAALILKRLVR